MNGFSKKTIMTFTTSVFIFGMDILILIFLSRILGPEGKGIYTITLLIPSLMLTFGNFGIATSNVYFIGTKKHKIEDVVSNSFFSSIIIGFLMIVIFFCLLNLAFFSNFLKSAEINAGYLWLIVLVIPVSLLSSMFQNIIRGKEEMKEYNKISILQTGAQFLAVLLFLIFLKKGIFGAVLAYVISIIASFALSFYYISRISKLRFSFNKKVFFESMVYGFKVYLANMLSILNYRVDMLMMAIFLNPAAIGIYSISVGMAEKLFIIPGALSAVLFPRVSSLKESEANIFTPKAVRHMLFLLIISCIGLAVLIKPIILILFGAAFLPAIFPFLILLPGIIAFGIGGTLASDLSGRGKPQYAIYSSITCLAINIILNIFFIPKWGASGAALASTISYWADTLVIVWAFSKISKRPVKDFVLIKKEDFKDYFYLLKELKIIF